MQYAVGNGIRLVNQNPVALFIESKPSTNSNEYFKKFENPKRTSLVQDYLAFFARTSIFIYGSDNDNVRKRCELPNRAADGQVERFEKKLMINWCFWIY